MGLGQVFQWERGTETGKECSIQLQGCCLPVSFFPVMVKAEYFVHSGKEEWKTSIFQEETRKTITVNTVM